MSVSLLKQYSILAKNITNFSGGQAKMLEAGVPNDSLKEIAITFSPSCGPYRGGTFNFTINLNNFPLEPPDVLCCTHIYHPNIGYDGEVCLNLLCDLWNSTVTLEDIVQGILFLFFNPNIKDPVSDLFDGFESYKDYKMNVRRSLRGNYVAGFPFTPNLPEDFQSDIEEDEEEEEMRRKAWETEYDTEEDASSDTEYNTEEDGSTCSDIVYSGDSECDTEEKKVSIYPLLRSDSIKSSSVDIEDRSSSISNMVQPFLVNQVASLFFFVPASMFSYGITFINRVGVLLTSRFSFWPSRTTEDSVHVVQR